MSVNNDESRTIRAVREETEELCNQRMALLDASYDEAMADTRRELRESEHSTREYQTHLVTEFDCKGVGAKPARV